MAAAEPLTVLEAGAPDLSSLRWSAELPALSGLPGVAGGRDRCRPGRGWKERWEWSRRRMRRLSAQRRRPLSGGSSLPPNRWRNRWRNCWRGSFGAMSTPGTDRPWLDPLHPGRPRRPPHRPDRPRRPSSWSWRCLPRPPLLSLRSSCPRRGPDWCAHQASASSARHGLQRGRLPIGPHLAARRRLQLHWSRRGRRRR